jgi:hypothetical protein
MYSPSKEASGTPGQTKFVADTRTKSKITLFRISLCGTHCARYVVLRTMDTSKAAEIIVCKHNGTKLKFVESGKGLYYYNTDTNTKARNTSTDYSFANRAVKIYGPDISVLHGKTTHIQVNHVPSNQVDPVLSSTLKEQSDVTLCLDILYIDGLVFVATVSRNLHFITIE